MLQLYVTPKHMVVWMYCKVLTLSDVCELNPAGRQNQSLIDAFNVYDNL